MLVSLRPAAFTIWQKGPGGCALMEKEKFFYVFSVLVSLEKLPSLSNKNYFRRSYTLEIDLQNLEIIDKEYPFLYLWHQNSIEKFTSYLMHKTIIVLRPDRH
jgi:hypothetical protein